MRVASSILCGVVVMATALVRPATAAVYDLHAAATSVAMPDGLVVPMWGFGPVGGDVSVPGPVLEVPAGDTTLTINLTNELPVAISIVIPQLPAPLEPVWDDGSTGARTNLAQRVVSFTHVAQPGETVVYEWTDVAPGTYVYHSGTHPAVQVPMGLYGAVKHDTIAGEVYDTTFDRDVVLVYGEVDPALNLAVDGGSYGTAAYPTTIDYRPRYLLINGQPTAPPALAIDVNERVLLRAVNAGLRSIVPTLTRGKMTVLAEDGHRAPFVLATYAMLLPAGQTRDALLVVDEPTTTVLFDRRRGSPLARFAAAEPAPVAVADAFVANEDTALDTTAAALPGVLANDTGVALAAVLDTGPTHGALALRADGSFSYTPAPDFNGTDNFRYHATSGARSSNVVVVSIEVAPVNDPPVAVDDQYATRSSTALTIAAPGLLANDRDVDDDPLVVELIEGPAGGDLVIRTDGAFRYTPHAATTLDHFRYRASDGTAPGNVATVTIVVDDDTNQAPVAKNDFAVVWRAGDIDVVDNDRDADGAIDPTTVAVVKPPRHGTATSLGNGTIRYRANHGFRGRDSFRYIVRDDDGASSAPATVTVYVLGWR